MSAARSRRPSSSSRTNQHHTLLRLALRLALVLLLALLLEATTTATATALHCRLQSTMYSNLCTDYYLLCACFIWYATSAQHCILCSIFHTLHKETVQLPVVCHIYTLYFILYTLYTILYTLYFIQGDRPAPRGLQHLSTKCHPARSIQYYVHYERKDNVQSMSKQDERSMS